MSLLDRAPKFRFSTQLKLGFGGGFYFRHYVLGESKQEFAEWVTEGVMYVSGGSPHIALLIVLGTMLAFFASELRQAGSVLVGREVKA